MPTVRIDEIDRHFPAFEPNRRKFDTGNGGGGRHAQCEGKQPFESWSLANEAAVRRPGRMAYRCRYCKAWHVGHRTR